MNPTDPGDARSAGESDNGPLAPGPGDQGLSKPGGSPSVQVMRYAQAHLDGVLKICAAEDWPSFPGDPERAHVVLTAPGVTSVVALQDDEVVGFAYLQSDGHIQAHLSLMAVAATHRRQGIGRALLEYAAPLTGALRVDLVTDTAEAFYASFQHHTYKGFRIYPG